MESNLKSERILLREWLESDAPALFVLAKDPLVGESAGFPPHPDEAESLRVIREILCKPETYAIVSAADGTLLGCINLFPGRKGEWVYATEEVKIGYWLGRPFWGCGLMAEAVRLLCSHCFDPDAHFRCAVIVGYAKEGNVRSRRVLEKSGFKLVETKDGACRYELLNTLQSNLNEADRRGWREAKSCFGLASSAGIWHTDHAELITRSSS